MNERQIAHLGRIKERTNLRLVMKYREGAQEHGGDLLDMSTEQLVGEALDEVTDLICYLETLRERLINERK